MRNRRDNSALLDLRDRIINDPKGDYDDALFHLLLRSSALGKEVIVSSHIVTDHGKRYLPSFITGGGRSMPLRSLILSFADENVELDGFLLDSLIIEKGFIEELISGMDESGIDAVSTGTNMRRMPSFFLTGRETDMMLRPLPTIQTSSYMQGAGEASGR